jgi:hypothetical protein
VNKNSVQGAIHGILADFLGGSTISFNSVSFNEIGIDLETMAPAIRSPETW